jgi:hypothetical protein
MAPPSGDETTAPCPFTIELEQDRWRPRTTQITTTYPPAPSTSPKGNQGQIETKFDELVELFKKKLGGVLNEERIFTFAMEEALKMSKSTPTPASYTPIPT